MLSGRADVKQLVEFDVEDCFLNTPRELVMLSLQFWLTYPFKRRRTLQCFAISKDCKAEDHVGKPCSQHFWDLPVVVVRATVEWELTYNSCFEVADGAGNCRVLEQVKGLPIGGHLSAALVELVALYREYSQPWPTVLGPHLTARYRDNFFVAVTSEDDCPMETTAMALSDLLQMPVKPERRGGVMRCLELRLHFQEGRPVRSLLAFRTDKDRQGESNDVQAWPQREDPRIRSVLPGLLSGLAAKLRFYTSPGVDGYSATIRAMYTFVKAKRYPSRWWRRPFALALLRVGAHPACLPRPLQQALGQCVDKNK